MTIRQLDPIPRVRIETDPPDRPADARTRRGDAVLQSFRAYVRTGIVLQVGAAPVINPVLTIGELEEHLRNRTGR